MTSLRMLKPATFGLSLEAGQSRVQTALSPTPQLLPFLREAQSNHHEDRYHSVYLSTNSRRGHQHGELADVAAAAVVVVGGDDGLIGAFAVSETRHFVEEPEVMWLCV